MMKPFGLYRPTTLSAACARVAADPDLNVFRAGGIDLLDLMKERIETPSQLVELGTLTDEEGRRMRGVQTMEDGGWSVGALVTLGQLAEFEDLPRAYAALREAAGSTATPAVRNAATLGGNLLQRPRCWYFRHADVPCLRKGGAYCVALDGRNRLHAIMGGGPCHIVHPSSVAPALLALDASVTIAGADGGTRAIPLSDLFVLPRQDPHKEHSLAEGEALLSIELPAAAKDQRSSHMAARERQTYDWPLVEAAVSVRVDGGVLRDVRVALGQVAPIPWRAEEAEDVLEGKKPSTKLFADAAEAAIKPRKTMTENAYKVPLARGLLRQTLHSATGLPLPE
jgi:xanthine dehydrogenase YagS FAD-binding subunit